MQARDIIAQSFGSLTKSFGTTATRQVNASNDFSKTMSDVQENQTKSNDLSVKDKPKLKDNSNGMKKLSNKEKTKLDDGERLEVKPEVKEAMETEVSNGELEGTEEEMSVVLASGIVLTPQLLQQGMEQLEDKITELVTEEIGRAHV